MTGMRIPAAGVVATGVVALMISGFGAGTALAQEPVAEIDELTGESTSVELDAGFVEALESLEVTPGTSGSASLADGAAEFPITGGNVTVFEPGAVNPYVQGNIMHEGSGLTLTAGETEVVLEDFVVDPGDPAVLNGAVSANGEVVAESVKLFDLDGSTLEPIMTDEEAGTATLTGTTVNLSDEAAEALNGAFETDALAGGTTVGIATIVVDLPGQMEEMPEGGVDTGGGSTADGDGAGLIAAGAATAVALAGTAGYLVWRRSAAQQR